MKALEQIGLSKGEIKVYLALLSLGQTTAGPIVDKAQVTRSKIYDILQRLMQKGLVSEIKKNSIKYFSAARPSNILEYLDKKEKEIQEDKKNVEKILPQLLLREKMSNDSTTELFTGIKGMETAFNIALESYKARETWHVIGASTGENVEQMQLFFNRLHRKRIKNKIQTKIIFNEDSKGYFKSQEQSKYVHAKYSNQTTPAAINIFSEYVIVAILSKEPVTLLIKSPEVVQTFKEHFKILWSQASILN